MMHGRVMGTVWGVRKARALEGRKLALVAELSAGQPSGRVIVAIDGLDAEVGREVVVSFGSGARRTVDASAGRAALADAAVTQIVEGRT